MNSENTSNQELISVKKLLTRGTGILIGRQVIIRFIGFAGNIILARILSPTEFGIFATVSFIITFFGTVGNAGLGAALIQSKGELADDEINSTFTIQQAIYTSFFLLILVLAPLVRTVYPNLPAGSEWFLKALGLSLLLTSFRSVPTILLERQMAYEKIATIEVFEVASYQLVAITMAISGYGIWSLICAFILRGLIGMILAFLFAKWKPKFRLNFTKTRKLLKFGIPYQLSGFLGMLTEAVTPVLVAILSGPAAVGYLNLAKNLSHLPVRIISDSFNRAAFPAFSKIQDDKESLKNVTSKSINLLSLVMVPVALFMAALGPELIQTLYGAKWLPSLHSYYFYLAIPLSISFLSPLYNVILSLGKSSMILYTATVLVILQWGLSIPLIKLYGFIGVPMAQPLIAFIFMLIYWNILKNAGLDIKISLLRVQHIFFGLFCSLLLYLMKNFISSSIFFVSLQLIIACVIYTFILYILSRQQLMELYELIKMKLLGVTG